MGKITGFMEIGRETPPRRPVARARQGLARIRAQVARRETARAGRALHGLRHPLLPQGLPARQHHSRLERSGLSRPLARGDRPAALDQQLSRSSPAASVRRRARKPAFSTSTTIRSRSSRSKRTSSITPGPKAGSRRSRTRARPARASRSSARDRPGWRARSSWRAPDTRSRSTSAPIASAAC